MQTITRALVILNRIADDHAGASLAEIAESTKLPLASCHRILAALTQDELIERHPTSKRYRPGPALVRLSASVSRTGVGPVLDAGLAKLRDHWQECFFLAAIVGDAIVAVRSVSAVDPNRMSVSVPLGRRMYPHAAASCKAILAHRSKSDRSSLIAAAGGLVTLTDHTVTDRRALERELDNLAEVGYGVCDQESEPGVAAFAVAVVPPSGYVQWSLAVIGPRDRLFASKERGMIDEMHDVARIFADLRDEHDPDSLLSLV
jgi:IclR family acetate operon transcriptional repressor